MEPVWIVDDDPSIRFVLEKALARAEIATRSFEKAEDVTQALVQAADQGGELPSVLVSDIRMPGGSGLELLEQANEEYPDLAIIIMTAYSDLDSAVSAFQRGAFEYLTKPFDVTKAVNLIERALSERRNRQQPRPHESEDETPEILGKATVMQDVFRMIGRLSQSLVTVMITGESGSGKELVARALHKHSPVALGPFIAINTAAIPQDLLESELFGHERGAFTGAQTQRRGRFEQADGGTLFLDEIGDMPFDLQTRLLRVLSEGQFYRVGGHVSVKVKVRVIAATHQNLEERVAKGLFREDLFHRLNVIRVRLPALRERAEDIPEMTRYFLKRSAQQLGVEPKRICDEALELIGRFPFPGNVRQLENTCHWLTVMAPSQWISKYDLPPEILQGPVRIGVQADTASTAGFAGEHPGDSNGGAGGAAAGSAAFSPAIDAEARQAGAGQSAATAGGLALNATDWTADLAREAAGMLAGDRQDVWETLSNKFEACLIASALQATGGRRIEAAQRLGIGRNTITRKIQELQLGISGASGSGLQVSTAES